MKSIVAPLVALAASFALAVHGCGGDPGPTTGSGTVTGTVNGGAFTVRDAITGAYTLFGQPVTLIALTDFAGACGIAKTNANVKNSGLVGFFLWNNDGNGHLTPVTTPGTYTVDDPNDPNFPTTGRVGIGTVVKNDATCQDTSVYFKSGTVTVTTVDSFGGFTGTFDGTTTANIHLTGTFTTPACTLPAPSDGGTSACN